MRKVSVVAKPDLDRWLPDPGLRVVNRRESNAASERLWAAAQAMRLADAALLGRLVRWRIPGLRTDTSFDQLFRQPPFMVLEDGEMALVSGLVGRIWTLRRDYPQLDAPEEYLEWSRRGSARVLFAHWVEPIEAGRTALTSEVRVEAFGAQGRLGVRAIGPLVRRFQNLIGSDGIEAAVRRAERR
jgi:hypothetical protein